MPLRIEKEKKIPFWKRFDQTLSKYIPAENKIRKKNYEDFLLNTKQAFSGKFGKLLWRIWRIKSSASSLNMCWQNQLAQVTNSRNYGILS